MPHLCPAGHVRDTGGPCREVVGLVALTGPGDGDLVCGKECKPMETTMGSRAFEAGATVFLRDGAEAVYVAATDDGGHIVRKVYDSDEEGPVPGKPTLTRDVFATPPVERFAAEIMAARADLGRVQKQAAEVRAEIEQVLQQ